MGFNWIREIIAIINERKGCFGMDCVGEWELMTERFIGDDLRIYDAN
jgi:hypothetical protein